MLCVPYFSVTRLTGDRELRGRQRGGREGMRGEGGGADPCAKEGGREAGNGED